MTSPMTAIAFHFIHFFKYYQNLNWSIDQALRTYYYFNNSVFDLILNM